MPLVAVVVVPLSVLIIVPEPPSSPRMEERSMPLVAVVVVPLSVLMVVPEPPRSPRMEDKSIPLKAEAEVSPSVLRESPEPPSSPRIEDRSMPVKAEDVPASVPPSSSRMDSSPETPLKSFRISEESTEMTSS